MEHDTPRPHWASSRFRWLRTPF